MMAPRGYERAFKAYSAFQAPRDYYKEELDGATKKWRRALDIGLFFCWLADGTPKLRQNIVT